MLVVARAVVWLATLCGASEFVRQSGGPLLPGKVSLLGKPDGQSESLGLPWFGEHGAALVARQARQGGELLGGGSGIKPVQGGRPKG